MKTKLAKSSIAALGAAVLVLATGACSKSQDRTADTGSSTTSSEVMANNDAAASAPNNTAAADSTGAINNAALATGEVAGTLPPVNPNPPVSAVEIALMGDPSLSSAAKNIQVSADDNKLVLRGSVPSNELKDQIEQKVREVAKDVQIDNQITVSSQ